MAENYFKPGIRETGYYWIKFPGIVRWQPGSWDSCAGYWLLIGSRDPWFDHQIRVGPKIEYPEKKGGN